MKHNQNGSVNVLLLPFALAILLLVGAVGFGSWAFSSRQDYKLNTDEKIANAVELAKQQESTEKDKQFAEAEKNPLKTYSGPEAFGSIVVQYPKTWSAYVDDSGNSATPVNGFFYPGYVPSINASGASFALRIQVLNQSYSDTVKMLSSTRQASPIKVDAYALPKVPGTVGVMASGQLQLNKTSTMVVLPLRDKTIEISTEGDQYKSDFTNYILPNITFSP